MGGTGGGTEQEPLCFRLNNPPDLSFEVTQRYRTEITRDCRISWVARLHLDVDEEDVFLNRLIRWNLELWGCALHPPEVFGLMYMEVPLTSADAEVLIGHYMDAATSMLDLSPGEIDTMRAMVETLADRVIERETDEFSDSTCPTGAGGESGAP